MTEKEVKAEAPAAAAKGETRKAPSRKPTGVPAGPPKQPIHNMPKADDALLAEADREQEAYTRGLARVAQLDALLKERNATRKTPADPATAASRARLNEVKAQFKDKVVRAGDATPPARLRPVPPACSALPRHRAVRAAGAVAWRASAQRGRRGPPAALSPAVLRALTRRRPGTRCAPS
jgi:hypothetical protein